MVGFAIERGEATHSIEEDTNLIRLNHKGDGVWLAIHDVKGGYVPKQPAFVADVSDRENSFSVRNYNFYRSNTKVDNLSLKYFIGERCIVGVNGIMGESYIRYDKLNDYYVAISIPKNLVSLIDITRAKEIKDREAQLLERAKSIGVELYYNEAATPTAIALGLERYRNDLEKIAKDFTKSLTVEELKLVSLREDIDTLIKESLEIPQKIVAEKNSIIAEKELQKIKEIEERNRQREKQEWESILAEIKSGNALPLRIWIKYLTGASLAEVVALLGRPDTDLTTRSEDGRHYNHVYWRKVDTGFKTADDLVLRVEDDNGIFRITRVSTRK